MPRFVLLLPTVCLLAAASACGSSASPASPPKDAGVDAAPLPSALAVTADWLHHTLSLVDFDALASHAASVRVGEIDLSKYAQGPYSVKLTPDGKTAIVALSAGFFTITGANVLVNAPTIPTGPSKVLFVDLASRSIEAELDTGDGATGIAVTHDGARAFVSHAGTTMITVLDVKARKILSQVDVGGTFAEEISLDDSDTVGVVTYLDATSGQKNVRTFAVADMAATLSPPIALNNDAAGVPFFPGTKTVYVVLAYNPLSSPSSGYALVDATNPTAPVLVVETKWTDATYTDYQAIPAPTRGTVLVPVTSAGKLRVREYALAASDVVLQKTYDVASTGFFGAFGAILDPQGRMVLTAPGDRQLDVLDLGAGTAFTVPWFTEAGPLGIALR